MATRTLDFYSSSRVIYPVHKGSTRDEVKFAPLSKRQAARLYHDARRFERRTRISKGKHNGRIGRVGLAVLHAMLFDCINYVSGELFPTYETLAQLAAVSRRSVARALVRLQSAGVLKWLRRCRRNDDGTFDQESNAYAVQPAERWNGYHKPEPPPPAPLPGTWGDHPKTADPLSIAAAALRDGDRAAAARALDYETDPNSLAAALGRWNRTRALGTCATCGASGGRHEISCTSRARS